MKAHLILPLLFVFVFSVAVHAQPTQSQLDAYQAVIDEKIATLPADLSTPKLKKALSILYWKLHADLTNIQKKPDEIIAYFTPTSLTVNKTDTDTYNLELRHADGRKFYSLSDFTIDADFQIHEEATSADTWLEPLIDKIYAQAPADLKSNILKDAMRQLILATYQQALDSGDTPEQAQQDLFEANISLSREANGKINFNFDAPQKIEIRNVAYQYPEDKPNFVRVSAELHNIYSKKVRVKGLEVHLKDKNDKTLTTTILKSSKTHLDVGKHIKISGDITIHPNSRRLEVTTPD